VCEYTYTYNLFVFSLVYTLSLSLWESEREGSNNNCMLFDFKQNLCVYIFECLFFSKDYDVQNIRCVCDFDVRWWWWWPQKFLFVCFLLILFYFRTE
jgi:hypothetical protein